MYWNFHWRVSKVIHTLSLMVSFFAHTSNMIFGWICLFDNTIKIIVELAKPSILLPRYIHNYLLYSDGMAIVLHEPLCHTKPQASFGLYASFMSIVTLIPSILNKKVTARQRDDLEVGLAVLTILLSSCFLLKTYDHLIWFMALFGIRFSKTLLSTNISDGVETVVFFPWYLRIIFYLCLYWQFICSCAMGD